MYCRLPSSTAFERAVSVAPIILTFGVLLRLTSPNVRVGAFLPRETVLTGSWSLFVIHLSGTIEIPRFAATILEIASSPSSSIVSFTEIPWPCSQASICLPTMASRLKRMNGCYLNSSSGGICLVEADTRRTRASVAIFENERE